MKIHRRIRGREGAEVRVVRYDRKDTARRRQRMPWREVRIETGERAERLANAQQILRKARHVARAVPVLRGLLEKETILDERTAHFDARGPPSDAEYIDG